MFGWVKDWSYFLQSDRSKQPFQHSLPNQLHHFQLYKRNSQHQTEKSKSSNKKIYIKTTACHQFENKILDKNKKNITRKYFLPMVKIM